MIFLEIATDQTGAYDWLNSEIEVDRVGGAAAAETWAFSSDYYGESTTTATGYEVILSLYDWLNNAGREWNGIASWTYSIAAVTNDYIGCTFTASADTWNITPTASFTAITGVVAVVGGTAFGPGAFAGSLDCDALALTHGLRHETGPAVCSPGAGYVAGLLATAHRPQRFEALLSDTQQRRCMDALAIASNPRRAYIYEAARMIWRWVALGLGDVGPTESPLYAHWAPDCWRLA